MKPLTVFEAEAEARFRWGSLFARAFARYSPGMRKPFEVGTKRIGSVTIRGRGASWESAFRDADMLTNPRGFEETGGFGRAWRSCWRSSPPPGVIPHSSLIPRDPLPGVSERGPGVRPGNGKATR